MQRSRKEEEASGRGSGKDPCAGHMGSKGRCGVEGLGFAMSGSALVEGAVPSELLPSLLAGAKCQEARCRNDKCDRATNLDVLQNKE